MANNKQPIKPPIKAADSMEVILIKLIIVFVILLVPITYMAVDLSQTYVRYSNLTNSTANNNENLNKQAVRPGSEFNFEAPLSAEAADINKVPKEKIDSLFINLKK